MRRASVLAAAAIAGALLTACPSPSPSPRPASTSPVASPTFSDGRFSSSIGSLRFAYPPDFDATNEGASDTSEQWVLRSPSDDIEVRALISVVRQGEQARIACGADRDSNNVTLGCDTVEIGGLTWIREQVGTPDRISAIDYRVVTTGYLYRVLITSDAGDPPPRAVDKQIAASLRA